MFNYAKTSYQDRSFGLKSIVHILDRSGCAHVTPESKNILVDIKYS